jgi:hypothetical protein
VNTRGATCVSEPRAEVRRFKFVIEYAISQPSPDSSTAEAPYDPGYMDPARFPDDESAGGRFVNEHGQAPLKGASRLLGSEACACLRLSWRVSAPWPATGGCSFEVKCDGFRCVVDTNDGFRATSSSASSCRFSSLGAAGRKSPPVTAFHLHVRLHAACGDEVARSHLHDRDCHQVDDRV